MNVVLLHGFGETSEIWDSFKPLLSKEFNLLAFDYSKHTFCQTIEEYADWLHSKIDELKIERFVLIGHSMGGYISLAYAEKYGQYLAGLGLFHSSAYADTEAKKEARLKTIQFLKKHGTAEFIEDFLPNMYNAEFRQKNIGYIKQQLQDNQLLPVEALITATEAMRIRPDRSTLLAQLSMPVLMIAGMKDKFISPEASLAQTMLLKQPYTLVVDHIAHAGMIEAPEICAALVNEFVSACIVDNS